MNSILSKSALTLMVLFVGTEPAMAKPISLFEAFKIASVYDGRVRSAKADSMIYRAEVGKARAQLLPNISATFYRGHTDTEYIIPSISQPSFQSASDAITLQQPLFNLQRIKAIQQARLGAAKGTIDLENERMSLITRVSGAYFSVLFAEENVVFSSVYLRAMKEHYDQAKSRYEREYGTITEVNEAEAAYEKALADQLDIINALEVNRQELKKLIGVYPKELCHLVPEKMRLSNSVQQNQQYWVELAMRTNLGLSSARKEVEMSRTEVGRQRAAGLPTLDLIASRSLSDDTSLNTQYKSNKASIGVQLTVPIFSGGNVSSSIQQAKARRLRSEEQLKLQELAIEANVRRYYDANLSILQQLKAYAQAVKSNEIALAGTREGFLAGFRTNLDVLNAQQKLLESRRDLARYRYTYLVNYLFLKQLAGTLSPEDVKEISSWFL